MCFIFDYQNKIKILYLYIEKELWSLHMIMYPNNNTSQRIEIEKFWKQRIRIRNDKTITSVNNIGVQLATENKLNTKIFGKIVNLTN